MRAKRPSHRRKRRADTNVELRLISVMSLLVVLVPMLLQTAVFENTAAIQVNLPSADDLRYLEDFDPDSMPEIVTVAVTDEGFHLVSGEQTLARVPLLPEGGFDFESLEEALEAAKARYPSQEALVLLVEDHVLYDDVVHTMDRARSFFPAVSLADQVVAPKE